MIKKLQAKGYINRDDPGFICTSLLSKEDVRRTETRRLADRLFGGSKKALFSALLADEELTEADLQELREIIEKR